MTSSEIPAASPAGSTTPEPWDGLPQAAHPPKLPVDVFVLERFEHFVYTHQFEPAARELVMLLRALDESGGQWAGIGQAPPTDHAAARRDALILNRLAAAVAALFADPGFQLSPQGVRQIITTHRWLATIFGASAFGHVDHVIQQINQLGYTRFDQLSFDAAGKLKFTLLYSPDSKVPMQPEAIWANDPQLAASLFVALLSPRIVISEEAHQKKEILLPWFTKRLLEMNLQDLPIGILHDVYMHCTYADQPEKHDIKRSINAIIARAQARAGQTDVDFAAWPRRDAAERPVLFVILEWFFAGHSIFRTHSLAIEALRARYRLVAISLLAKTDELTRAIFDEVHLIEPETPLPEVVAAVRRFADALHPAVVYYPSVGMFLQTVFLTNLRFAPIQMASYGHPATFHSGKIDYFVADEDFIGDPTCFSECVVAVPKESSPYRLPVNCPEIPPQIRQKPATVDVAVAATSMKLNPRFLDTLSQIRKRCATPVTFHFFLGNVTGLSWVYVRNLVHSFLPEGAVVYPAAPYAQYLNNINRCDLFLDPFPFGNTNSLVDTVRQGLPGVCLSGAEVSSHIDEGLFRRLGLPDWTITRTVNQYVMAASKLIDDHDLRYELSQQIIKTDPDKILLQGDPRIFLRCIEWLEANHERLQWEGTRYVNMREVFKRMDAQGPA
jgi:hypothetical protein